MKDETKNLVRQIKSIELINSQLKELKDQLNKSNVRLEALESQINFKFSQIKSYEKKSVLLNFFKLIRNNNNFLEISKAHYLSLCLEYNEILQEIEMIQFEIEILQSKSIKIGNLKSELRSLIKSEWGNSRDKKLIVIHKKIIKDIEFNLRLEKEIEEAIKEGVVLNKKFNTAINFLKKTFSALQKSTVKTLHQIGHIDVQNIEKYQMKIIRIKHSLIKFKVEINDVYAELKINDQSSTYSAKTFIQVYRGKLAKDIIINKGLTRSYQHLKEQKELILEFTKTLRRDLKTVKKELVRLEKAEHKLISAFQ